MCSSILHHICIKHCKDKKVKEEEIIGFVLGMFALELPLEIDKLNEEIKDGIYINRNIETVPEGKKAVGDSITIKNKGADFQETATGTVFRIQHFEAEIKLETNSPEINILEIRTKEAILNLLDAYKEFERRYFRIVPVSMTKKAVAFDVVAV